MCDAGEGGGGQRCACSSLPALCYPSAGCAPPQPAQSFTPASRLTTQTHHPHKPTHIYAQVFSLLNLTIERLGPEVIPHVGALLPLLPEVWQQAEGQSLLRIQVGRQCVGWRGGQCVE